MGRSIRLRLMFLAAGIPLIVLIGVVLTANLVINKSLTENAVRSMGTISHDRAELVETYIKKYTEFLDGFSKSEIIYRACENPEDAAVISTMQRYTNDYAKDAEFLEGLYLALPDTYVLTHTNHESLNKTFRSGDSLDELQKRLMEREEAFCTGVTTAPVTQKYVVPIYKRLSNAKGEMVGFVGAAFYTDGLQAVLDRLDVRGDSTVRYSLILADTGEYIFDKEPSLIGQICDNQKINEILEEIKTNPDNSYYGINSGKDISSCYYMKDRNWLFVVTDSADTVLADSKSIQTGFIFIVLVAAAVLIIASTLGVNKVMKPVKLVEDSVERMYRSDYSKNSEIDTYLKRNDEIGSLVRTVDRLREVNEYQNIVFDEFTKEQDIGFLVIYPETEEVLKINQSAAGMLNLKKAVDAVPNLDALYALVSKKSKERVKEMLEYLIADKENPSIECVIESDEDKFSIIKADSRYIDLSGERHIMILLLTDITDKKNIGMI